MNKFKFGKKALPVALFVVTAIAIGVYPYVNTSGAAPKFGTGHIQVPVPPLGIDPANARKQAKIEVVFVLDTTSSMSGMIQAAKDNIWSIASTMASAQPAPEIHMGLVAFRDRGDEYVTKVFDLSEDLDSMYSTLMDFKAIGGGDGPESVNQALHDAVNKISWSQDPNSYQVIFLVGDAPPHMDYSNEVQYPQTIRLANQKGILINTIQAGQDQVTRSQWQKIANMSQGDYFNVEQSGSAIAVATPFDKQIAELSAELDETRIYYGSKAEKAKQALKVAATDKLHNLASVASRARRAMFNATESGAKNFLGEKELVSAIAEGRVDLDDLEEAELPTTLQALPAEERVDAVRKQAEKREVLNTQIVELTKKRDSYLADEVAKAPESKASLDYQIFETIVGQSKDKGFEYSDAPKY